LGGAYAVAVFLPGFSFLSRPVYRLLFGVLMVLVAYGAGRELPRQTAVFLAVCCALGGGVMAIGYLDAGPLGMGKGVVSSVPDLKVVLLSGAACYFALSVLSPGMGRHGLSQLSPVSFELMGRRVELTALLDTGNTLTDPVTGQSVSVAEGEALRGLFPPEHLPTPGELRDPVSGLERLNAGRWTGRFRLLSYRAVGVERGFLLAVRTDCMTLNGKRREGALVALSPTPVSDGGGYRVLTGGSE
jgi:stage II sporulation protein GA (sporulation sigma-E factor processing peptidase)